MSEKNLNADQVAGRAEQIAADVKETVGEATGNRGLEREGERDHAAGVAQEAVGDLKEGVDDAAANISEAVRERNEK